MGNNVDAGRVGPQLRPTQSRMDSRYYRNMGYSPRAASWAKQQAGGYRGSNPSSRANYGRFGPGGATSLPKNQLSRLFAQALSRPSSAYADYNARPNSQANRMRWLSQALRNPRQWRSNQLRYGGYNPWRTR